MAEFEDKGEGEESEVHAKVSCENDCEAGFDVYLTAESMILVCKMCQTEYEISGRSGPPGTPHGVQ